MARHTLPKASLSTLALAALALPAAAQQELLSLNGGSRGTNFGTSVALVSDVNGDGVNDFAVGLPHDDTAGLDAGRLRVYSGADGALLFSYNGSAAGDLFGFSIAAIPDVDGDGKGEILVGAPFSDAGGGSSGKVVLVSGAGTGALLTINGPTAGERFGYSVAYGGTTGVFPFFTRRLVVGAPYKNNGSPGEGSVYLYTESGGLLHEWIGAQANQHMGWSVSGGYDANNDGVPDVLIGTPDFDTGQTDVGNVSLMSGSAAGGYGILKSLTGNIPDVRSGAAVCLLQDVSGDGLADFAFSGPDFNNGLGTVWVYNGFNGLNIYSKNGSTAGGHFGACLASAGDHNLDGRTDFLIGAPDDTGGGAHGTVTLFNGINGSALFKFTGTHPNGQFGAAIAGGLDVNGDNRLDCIVGSPEAAPIAAEQGNVRVFSELFHTEIYSIDGPTNGDQLGYVVSNLGDVNNDGFDDFLVGAPEDDWTHLVLLTFVTEKNAGSVRCVSGANGATLWTIFGAADNDELGYSLAPLGDINGDGKPDFAVGAPQHNANPTQPGFVRICSGANGATIATVTGGGSDTDFGWSLAPMPDVTGDGRKELIIGSPGYSSDRGRAVRVNSGTWTIGLNWFGIDVGERYGHAVTAIADVNNDGKADVLIGAPSNDAVAANAGRAYCRSGVLDAALFTLSGAASGEQFGSSVCSFSWDYYFGFAIGAPGADYVPANFTDCGMVRSYFANTQIPYWTIYGTGNFSYFGNKIANIGDYNLDSFDDMAVGSSEFFLFGSGEGQVQVISGYYGVVQYTFDGAAGGDGFGYGLSPAGDINNDGTLDLLVGAPFADPVGTSSGNVKVISLKPVGVTYYGTSTPGCDGPQTLHLSTAPKVGQYWLIHGVSNAPPGALGLLLITNSPDYAGSDVFSIGVTLYVDFFLATQVYGVDITATGTGNGLAITPIPNNAFLAGTHYYAQSVWAWQLAQCNLGGFNLSASTAAEFVIQP